MAAVAETTWLSTIWHWWEQCVAVAEWCATGSVAQWAWSLLVLHFFSGYTKVYPQTNPALIGSGLIWFELSTWARQDKLRLNDKVIAVTVLLKHLPLTFASISYRPGPSFSKGGRRAPLDFSLSMSYSVDSHSSKVSAILAFNNWCSMIQLLKRPDQPLRRFPRIH